MHLAAADGQADALTALLDKTANMEARDVKNQTCVHLAVTDVQSVLVEACRASVLQYICNHQ